MKFGLKDSDIKIIKEALKKFPEIEEALIFGSRAKGNQKKASDIDIAIKGNAVSHETILKIKDLLEEETTLPYFFDVVHYETISNVELKNHIDRVGRRI